MRGAPLPWFIDNLGILSALCKGSSTVSDIGCVIHAVLLATAAHSCSPWWEHVESAYNASDGGARSCTLVAKAIGVNLEWAEIPQWPRACLSATPEVWLRWLRAAEYHR